MIKLFIFCISFIFFSHSYGAKNSIKNLRNKVSNQALKINKLAAQVRDLDKRISITNDDYLEKVRSLDQLEKKLAFLKGELQTSAIEISTNYEITKKALDHYLIEASDDSEESIKNKAIFYEILSKKMKSLKEAQFHSNNLLDSINTYEQKVDETKKTELSLYSLIVEMENKKKEVSQEYVQVLENKNKSQEKLDSLVARLKAKRKNSYRKKVAKNKSISPTMAMNLPIDAFDNVKKDKKGIIFKFTEVSAVKAPNSGKVVYADELSNYGKVIMIDHGNNVRSVILGDMSIKVQKNQIVEQGSLLGYTLADPGISKSLYYEVRKSNKAQNTINWISKNNRSILKI